MSLQVESLSQKLAQQDVELLSKQQELKDISELLNLQIQATKKATDVFNFTHLNLLELLKRVGINEVDSETQPEIQILSALRAISSLITSLQSDIQESHHQVADLLSQKEESLQLLKEQGMELATAKVVTNELESEVAHIRSDRDQAVAVLQKCKKDLIDVQAEMETKQEQVNVLTSIVEAIRTAGPITWSDVSGNQFQKEFTSERGGSSVLPVSTAKKAEAAYHF